MKLAELAMLKDLARSHKLIERSLKRPSRDKFQVRRLGEMPDVQKVILRKKVIKLCRMAQEACEELKHAHVDFAKKELYHANDRYFKAAAIASNVIFCSKMAELNMPDNVRRDMEAIIAQATGGIQNVMKMVAIRKIRKHEKKYHKKKGAKEKKK